ncbi:MAG: hypothetical protein KGV50_02535 [Gammaproteobacteria bacterium]|nr:hypothetical protein [Gammaproteobacteria bacterium]
MKNNIIHQDQRLVILRSLVDCNNDANESILQDCLAVYGHRISRDLVRNHLDWLEEQSLVTLNKLDRGNGSQYYVATITLRGEDVAQGVCTVSGVKKPRAEW